jgi:hypothetical protein
MKIFRIAIVLSICICLGLVAYALIIRVPTKTFRDLEWFQEEEKVLGRIETNERIRQMIRRARIEHFINPATSGKRVIFFDRAWATPTRDAVYLMFGIVGRSDFVVVYRGDLRDGRLLWKAPNSRSP